MLASDVLSRVDIFQGLDSERLAKIARITRQVRFEAGAVILREGDLAANLYMLEEGRVAIMMRLGGGREIVVHSASPGEVFAWSALVEPHRSTAAVRALANSRALAIKGEDLRRLFEADPVLGYRVMDKLASVISTRLRDTRLQLADVIQS